MISTGEIVRVVPSVAAADSRHRLPGHTRRVGLTGLTRDEDEGETELCTGGRNTTRGLDRARLRRYRQTDMVGANTRMPLRLVDILKALPNTELSSLVSRLGVRIDPAKRLDPPAQIARALVALPELRDPGRLPQASVELLHRVA